MSTIDKATVQQLKYELHDRDSVASRMSEMTYHHPRDGTSSDKCIERLYDQYTDAADRARNVLNSSGGFFSSGPSKEAAEQAMSDVRQRYEKLKHRYHYLKETHKPIGYYNTH